MFHCSGWTFTWAVTAAGGTHVCLRRVEPNGIFDAIAEHGVTHMCGAPTVLNMLVHAPAAAKRPLPVRTKVATGGAAPPAIIIERMEAMGFEVLHLYGTTESYGPSTYCAPMAAWQELPPEERYMHMARQGIPNVLIDELIVADPQTLRPVPRDGASVGEIRRPRRRSPAAAIARATSPPGTPTAALRSRTARRTSSSPAARTSPRSRSRRSSTAIRTSSKRRSSPAPMPPGENTRAPL
jgi:acyl-CoA synthetase (AMP-forming)/AMP-acid ligase II